jgi:hypothetical protein
MLNKANEALQIDQQTQQIKNGAREGVMGNAMLGVSMYRGGDRNKLLSVTYLTTLSASQTILVQWLGNK